MTIIIIYLMSTFVISLFALLDAPSMIELIGIFNPFKLYEDTKMNIFGCGLVVIIHSILMPWILIFAIIALIFKLIYFLCHVGRKK